MEAFTILIGTMTGNAEFAAEEMQQVLRDELGRQVDLLMMDDLGPEVFQRDSFFLVCTSTYGEGDVPENARLFYGRLCEERPDLTGVRYAVFGLGDSTYRATFNFGGEKFDCVLASLGASRLGERAKHDAQSGVTAWDYGRDWIRGWYVSVQGMLK
jgi:MioC protein